MQSAWGVVPAHLNELAPAKVRGLLPGLVYQLGVVASSGVSYIEAHFGEHCSYTRSMSISMVIVMVVLWFVIKFGPEAKGVDFLRSEPEPLPAQKMPDIVGAMRNRGGTAV